MKPVQLIDNFVPLEQGTDTVARLLGPVTTRNLTADRAEFVRSPSSRAATY